MARNPALASPSSMVGQAGGLLASNLFNMSADLSYSYSNFSGHGQGVQYGSIKASAAAPSAGIAATQSRSMLLLSLFLCGIAMLMIRYPDCAIGCERRTDLKGPRGLPLLGNLFWALKNRDPLGYQVYAQKKYGYGNTHTLPGLGRLIDISRPDWIEHVQKTQFSDYVKGPSFHDQMKDVLGDGIFTSDGERWKMQRKVASRIFSVSSFKHIITRTIREDCALLEKILYDHADKGDTFNMQELFFRFTLSSFVKIAFSQDTGSLSKPDQPDEFGEAFNYAQKVLDMRFVQPWWKLSEKYNETGRKMRECRKIIDNFTDEIVENRRSQAAAKAAGRLPASDGGENDGRKDLLDLFMAHRMSDGSGLSNKQLKDTILNLLIAGRDTTAEALSWMTWHILTKPSLYRTIQDEIDTLSDGGATNHEIDYDGFDRLHLQKLSAFYETLRLHPSIPKNIRRAVNDDVLPNGGPRIRKGDIVLYSDWAMARNPDIWGKDACEFRPDRWIDSESNGDHAGEATESIRKVSQFKAHFFNGGPRLCLGQKLATFEVTQVINSIFGKFDLELVDLGGKKSTGRDKVPEYLNSLTHPMKRPLMVRVKRRGASAPTA
ncbi:cytochrome p450 oxidoreductase [Pseudozyma flocculosa PF-1]|uniref:Putative cytochrome P450 monooxygenase n=1 Tax=Pseudozyma flocculosa TaxID=84751 RepID=B2CYP2_9BASI|nr:cytochrome p450 oxidoreductase [Pseudozyma flocculosa PF-1]ACB59278.1 putative cytochrome P450 monooxygenase [Pseudozyma flocculosa]EPQ31816.1 cytochrome p450 oxidoreductase [Pseudozyma flocculosa PF-1]SPO35290.1 related to Cytochrome P450 enzyme invovled in Glycolipid production [Pseudozyma flocculosa]